MAVAIEGQALFANEHLAMSPIVIDGAEAAL